MAMAECFFLKGRSTELAIPIIEVFASVSLAKMPRTSSVSDFSKVAN